MHFLSGGDASFARFIGVAANAHRLLERGDIDEFVLFHERVVKLVGMCRNRVRRAAYATSKNMLVSCVLFYVNLLVLALFFFMDRLRGRPPRERCACPKRPREGTQRNPMWEPICTAV